MEIHFCNENNKGYQNMLNDLLKDIFGDFKFWYDLNLWNSDYESYSIIEDEKIIANVCVYKIEMILKEKKMNVLSIGAVATRKEHRGRGLLRIIMEHIQKKYENVPMYLSANEKVTEFYPKFGFKRLYEESPSADYKINNHAEVHKLPFDSPKVRDYVFNRKVFSKELDFLNTAPINMFHIYSGYLKECLYEIPELQTLVIGEKEAEILKVYGVFSFKEISFKKLASLLPFEGIEKIEFSFMPYWDDLAFYMERRQSDPFFVKGEDIYHKGFKVPELSIT